MTNTVEALRRIRDKLIRMGASLPIEVKGTIESAMTTGHSHALLLVEEEIALATSHQPAEQVSEPITAVERAKTEADLISELNHAQWLALENVRLLAARHRREEWAQHMLRFVEEAGTNKARITRAQVEAALATPEPAQMRDAAAEQAQEKPDGYETGDADLDDLLSATESIAKFPGHDALMYWLDALARVRAKLGLPQAYPAAEQAQGAVCEIKQGEEGPYASWLEFPHALKPGTKLYTAPPSPDQPAQRAGELPERWYVGSMNDGCFIINRPPRPSHDHRVHDADVRCITGFPSADDATFAAAQRICDAHNAAPPSPDQPAQRAGELQGGMDNDELREAWARKLPGVEPTDRDLTAFALGVEVGDVGKRTYFLERNSARDAWRRRVKQCEALEAELAEARAALAAQPAVSLTEESRRGMELLQAFSDNPAWELSSESDDGALFWTVYSVTGWPNDRDFNLVGRGRSPAEAIEAALLHKQGGKT